MNWLRGTGTALVTPFTDTLAIDFDGLKSLMDKVMAHTEFLVVCGTTAESATLTKEEKSLVLSHVVKRVAESITPQMPVVYGLGGNDTGSLLDDIVHTDFTGVAAILSVCPYYNKPSQAGIRAHYEKIADASPVPVILYNVPGRTVTDMNAATVGYLSKHPNIIGLKEASADLSEFIRKTKEVADPNFAFLSGDDALTTAMIALGARGTIAVMPNALPEDYCNLVRRALEGDFAGASAEMRRLMDLNDLLYAEGNPVGVKAAAELAGIGIRAWVRLPLMEASQDLRDRLMGVLAGFQLTSKKE